jgi:hypothetical protein
MKRTFCNSFLLMAGLLVGSELIVRVFFARNMSGRFEYGYAAMSGFEERSDGSVRLVRAGGRRFHPQTFPKQRPAETFRVMVVGDSVPRGPSLQQSYAVRVAEQLLSQGKQAEGINLAVAGYGARRNQIVFRQALEYQPSLMILHVNNSNEYEDEREWKRSQEFKGWHPKNWLMKSLVIRRLYELKTEKVFWELLPTEIRTQRGVSDADAELATSNNTEKTRVWQERVRQATAEAVALARARSVPILLLTQASIGPGASGKPRLDDHGLDTLARQLVGSGVFHLSMKETLELLDFVPLFADGSHLRADGHEVLAKAVINLLQHENQLR